MDSMTMDLSVDSFPPDTVGKSRHVQAILHCIVLVYALH